MMVQHNLKGEPITKVSPEKSVFEKFGVDKDTYEKSKDILPTLDIGKLPVGSYVTLTFLDDLPREITVDSKFHKKPVITRIMRVNVHDIGRMEGLEVNIIPTNKSYSLWLSSKSLSLGIVRIHEQHNALKGITVKISIGLTDYKEYGENRCYTVEEIIG